VIVRRLAAILFVPLMFAFGAGVYFGLGTLKSKAVKERAQLPTVTKPKFVLPGTMFVVQAGRIFKLNSGSFTEIGPSGNWSQPSLTPDHSHLVAVLTTGYSSDLYLLDTNGAVVKRLTHNAGTLRHITQNHWAFYPHVSTDGQSVFFDYDYPKFTYNDPGVDLSVWSMPIQGTVAQGRRWTDPYSYTGGDTDPIPTGGGVLFVRHTIDPTTAVHSQIEIQTRPLAFPRALTPAADDCTEPSLSPDSKQVVMICSHSGKFTTLEVAPFNGVALGPRRILLQGGLYAAPAWSPDGTAIAYYAPVGITGHFELWYMAVPPPPTPMPSPSVSATGAATASASVRATPIVFPTPAPAPIQVTQGVDLTATSAPAWY
jgi:Tol biopolymer transport system component